MLLGLALKRSGSKSDLDIFPRRKQFQEGTFSERVTQASASLNGTQAEVESSTPPPSGQIQIAGFSRIEKSGDNELAFVTAEAPEGTVTATGGFPIQVLLSLRV